MLITGYITGQKKNPEIKIIPKGYYVKKLNDEPILWILSHKKDTLKIYTNKTELTQSFQEVENIKSIDILKDKKAKDNFGEFGKNGVIYVNFKKANWKEIDTLKKTLNPKNIAVQVLKTRDTIYIKEALSSQVYSKQIFLKESVLKIRENGLIHKVNNVELFLCSNEEITISNKLKISHEEIKAIVQPLISFNSHSKGSYHLLFDIDLNKIIWQTNILKYNYETTSNGKPFTGKLFTGKNGLYTSETIEIDAMTGNLIKKYINDKVQIRIR